MSLPKRYASLHDRLSSKNHVLDRSNIWQAFMIGLEASKRETWVWREWPSISTKSDMVVWPIFLLVLTPKCLLPADDCIILVVSGEFMNFAAYGFAPAILVTPLGALSVLIGSGASSSKITKYADSKKQSRDGRLLSEGAFGSTRTHRLQRLSAGLCYAYIACTAW